MKYVLRLVLLLVTLSFIWSCTKKNTTEPIVTEEQNFYCNTIADTGYCRIFYNEWLWDGSGQILTSFKWQSSLNRDIQELPLIGGLIIDGNLDVIQLIGGGYYYNVDSSYLPEGLRLSSVDYLDYYYWWIGFDVSKAVETGSYALIVETNLRSEDEIIKRAQDFLNMLKPEGLKGTMEEQWRMVK